MASVRAFSDHSLASAQRANDDALRKVRKRLEAVPRGLDKVLTRTANKVAQGAKTDAVRMMPQYLNVKQKDVRKHFQIARATWAKQEARLMAVASKSVGLETYNPTPGPNAKRKPAKGPSVKIYKTSGAKVIGGAFWVRNKTGKAVLMKRIGKERTPVRRLYGMSFITLYRRPAFLRRMTRRINERMVRVLPQEIRGVLRQGGAIK